MTIKNINAWGAMTRQFEYSAAVRDVPKVCENKEQVLGLKDKMGR